MSAQRLGDLSDLSDLSGGLGAESAVKQPDEQPVKRPVEAIAMAGDANGGGAIELRDYQRAAIDALYCYWRENKGRHPLVEVPTGAGKSVIMAALIQEVIASWKKTRIVVATHVRELIAQNHAELLRVWPEAPAGVYSAGLARRDAGAQVLFAGIQSVHGKAVEIGHTSLLLIDEAHLVPPKSGTMYRRFIDELLSINPKLKVVGFTATPYRLDSGPLHDGKARLFDGLAYTVPVDLLVKRGHLAPAVAKETETALDVDGVSARGGEYVARELQAAVDKETVTNAAMDEIVARGRERRSWLVFASGVGHAHHIADALRERGIACGVVTGTTPAKERDRITEEFKVGVTRALVSVGVLTTGFNAPAVDLIALLRPTLSTGLYVQMVGRGMRTAEGKENCLVLDFAGLVARHGPVDHLFIRTPSAAGDGVPPVKTCPECRSIVRAASRRCPDCGHEFPIETVVKITAGPSELPIMGDPTPVWLKPLSWRLLLWRKANKPVSLRVDYHCDWFAISEWLCFEHGDWAWRVARDWWIGNGGFEPPPMTAFEALTRENELLRPASIRIERPNVNDMSRFNWTVTGHISPETPARRPAVFARPRSAARRI